MKKIIATFLSLALLTMIAGPSLTVAVSPNVNTGLTRGSGGGDIPVIKAKWEMKGPCLNGADYIACPSVGEGNDDEVSAGAQFDAPGVWGANMNYTVCAIATDPDGVADLAGVYADIYYPEGKAIHDRTPSTDVHRDTARGTQDIGVEGCGEFIEENTLHQLTKAEGYHLFCEEIRDNNYNLPVFSEYYDYDEICAPDGELMKEEAYVYCSDKDLIWEDPAGDYKVNVFAQDNASNNSVTLTNYFEYMPFTGFEKDFSSVSYGQVMLNTHKKISGDLTFGNGIPSIRNVGNTRLWMKVAQDDMGLGQSSGIWNVQYDGRVGNNESDWTNYDPFGYKGTTPGSYAQLEDIVDLSELEEMDFSILVKKWPNVNTSYSGTMWLSATSAPFRNCVD